MSYLYVKWNSFGLRPAPRRFRHLSTVCLRGLLRTSYSRI